MNCSTFTPEYIDARCDKSVGGIKAIYIANRDDIQFSSLQTNEQEEITSLQMAEGKYFAKWQFRKNTGSYTSTYASDMAIGNETITTTVALQFSRAEATKRLKIQKALNSAAVVIIEDMYGQLLFLGEDNEVVITECTMQSGTQTGDLSGFNLSFQDIADRLPKFFVKDFDMSDLLVPAEEEE